ncbi:MAG: 4-carboxymuconolactone decarboxylase, partial [Alphaproteobacteria bacterium]
MSKSRFERGLEIRKKVLGESHVSNLVDKADEFTRDFQRFVTETCWNDVWGRDGISVQRRCLNQVCIMAALNRTEEFEIHFRA